MPVQAPSGAAERTQLRRFCLRRLVAPVACGVVLIAQPAAAAGQPEAPHLDDLPVVLSMTRMPQRIDDAPGAVTLITREDIERLGYRRLTQVLRLVPGMNVMSDTGHSPAVFYHGLGSLNPNRMQVLIDGRSVYSPYLYGYVDWDALPLTMDEIERVEVIRGSNAATYGSNAVAGVVNIVTRSSYEGPAASVSTTLGNRNISDVSARVRRSFGPLSIAINARTMGDDGFEQRNDDSRLNASTLRADLVLDGSDEFNLMAGQSSGSRGVGYPFGVSGNRDNSNGFRDVSTENWFAHLRFRRLIASDNEWSVGIYHNEDRGREEWFGEAGPFFGLPVGVLAPVPIDYNRIATRQNLDFQHQFVPLADWRIAWGVELRRDELKSGRMFSLTGRESQGLFRVSLNAEWSPNPMWTLNFGNMIERFQGHSPQASPRFFATLHVSPQHALKAGVSRAFRQPALIEARGDSRFVDTRLPLPGGRIQRTYVGNPSLQPERLDSAEFGYVGQFGRSTLDVRAFYERFNHLISETEFSDPAFPLDGRTYTEMAGVRISGIEYQYRYRNDTREIWWAHALPRITEQPSCDPGQTCFSTTVPTSSWSLTWFELLPRDWSVSATLFGVNAAQVLNGSERIDAYQSIDARIAKKFRTEDAVWEAALSFTDIGPGYETFNDNRGRVPFNRVARQTMLTLRASWF
ncbi:TonB-dependent siderophore receptor [Methyloversatilis sp.]|uniref:TonB-dependent receptor plug domain-containing protein n=1 Tax=Methyloversatilis sp. TaxID=2569862 RepID=UPI002736FD58|nr:TonB-dependent receptor [Methyloversatilis sp.]MDP3457315.1 TonB-dependent receptor [Methyloversatilis sp.]MDP3577053.1 TonB-dependent receptor [Methyloversatilis sp.]